MQLLFWLCGLSTNICKLMAAVDSDSEEDQVLFDTSGVQEGESLLQNGQNEDKQSRNRWSRLQGFKSKYPKSIFLILGTEFCERFNFYGLKTILVIYMTEWLLLPHHRTVAIYHSFVMLAYFSPLFGAIIADGYFGRFKTIWTLSLVYAAGTLILALTAFPPPELYGPIIGLLLIGLGTGGIKPCVAAFGGDQFSSEQVKERESFFSAFYFMINLGSALATFVSPILRADVHCIGKSCYPLAFGVPTLLMILSVVIFVSGKNIYKHLPPSGNLFGRVVKCVGHALAMRIRKGKKTEKDSHWLDYATDKYEESFVEDVKTLLRVLWLFLPLPLFWALFDQQGSRWTLQAVTMNGDLGVFGRAKPDQIQVLNPFLILVLIPVFDKLVYPCLNKLHIPNRPLQRMSAGMVLCSFSFLIASFLQMRIEDAKDPELNGRAGLTFLNAANCNVAVKASFDVEAIPAFTASPYFQTEPGDITMSFHCGKGDISQATISTQKAKAYRVIIASDNPGDPDKLRILTSLDERNKDGSGRATLSVASFEQGSSNTSVVLRPYKNSKPLDDGAVNIWLEDKNVSNFTTVEPGLYKLFILYTNTTSNQTQMLGAEPLLNLGTGSVRTVVVALNQEGSVKPLKASAIQFISIEDSKVSMLYLIPQYFVISVGEILFSISGLAFAYSQAPASMKSVLQSVWLLTVAFGNLIVMIVAEIRLPSQTMEYVMFAGVMFLDAIVFMVMAYKYKSRSLLNSSLEVTRDDIALLKRTGSSDNYTDDTDNVKKD